MGSRVRVSYAPPKKFPSHDGNFFFDFISSTTDNIYLKVLGAGGRGTEATVLLMYEMYIYAKTPLVLYIYAFLLLYNI